LAAQPFAPNQSGYRQIYPVRWVIEDRVLSPGLKKLLIGQPNMKTAVIPAEAGIFWQTPTFLKRFRPAPE
jgi:hypothetical protein